MKTSILKKSLLNYAIKGNLSSRFRKSNPNLNAFDEINAYNAQILKDKKIKEKELKEAESKHKAEKDKEAKQILKTQMQELKKEIAKLKTIAPLNADSAPFPIPPSWVWVRLGDIGEWKAGSTPSRSNPNFYIGGNILWLKTGDLNNDYVYSTEEKITQEAFESCSMALNKIGSILIAMYGATIGKVGIVGKEMATNQACCACDTHKIIFNKFLFYYLQSANDFIISQSFGSGQPNISKEKILNFLIPLPPLAEQKAIVETLDSLIALVNTFDKTKEELKRIEKRIEKSLLQYAIFGKLSNGFRKNNPALNAFLEIESYNAQILKDKKSKEKELKELESKLKTQKDKELKQTLKQTIQNLKKEIAKLTTITPLFCDSTMKDLESQGIEKSNFQYKNNICHSEAKPKNLTFSNQNEIFCSAQYDNDKQNFAPPFAIPPTWAWVRLGEVCENFTGDSINADKKDKEFMGHKEGLNYIGTKDISIDRQIIYENGVKIPYSQAVNFKIAKKYSTLLCLEGGSAGKKIGFLEENVCFGNKLCCFESFFCNTQFMYFYLQSPLFLQTFNLNIVGIIGGVSKDKIKDFLIPLPPLKEQEYITYTLDTLFTLTKGLKCE